MKPSRPGANQPEFMRPAVLPGLLCAAAILVGLFVGASDWFITVRFAVSILAAIMVVFAIQGRTFKTYVFVPFLLAIVVLWNPLVSLTTGFAGQWWLLTQVAASALTFAAGIVMKTPVPTR